MFGYNRKKRLRNKVIAAAVGVAVMTFGIWLNYSDNDDKVEETVQKIEIEEDVVDTKSTADDAAGKETEDKEAGTETAGKTYLVKEENGVVKVFLCEGNKRELYLITSIPYDVLSETDQNMLTEGVTIDTDDDLGKFLENFDS